MQFRNPRAVVLLFGGILVAVQAAFWLLPRASFSVNEKRVLADTPRLTLSDVADGSAFTEIDSYLSDHFPGRDALVGANAYLSQAEGRNALGDIVRGRDGWLFPAPLAEDSAVLDKNMQAIAAFADKQTVPVYLMAVPTAGAVVTEKLPALHFAYPDAALLEQARQLSGDNVHWVDVMAAFADAAQPESLYYRTDHHWTSTGAYAAYCLLMQAQGRTPAAPDAFDVERVAGFYGTSYAKSGLWLTAPDEIELWTDPALQTVTTVYDANQPEPIRQEGMLFRAYLDEADKYPVFLSGNHAQVHIETSADTGRHLLVIKDSYAHALAPFLAEEYQTIDLIDLRYFKQGFALAVQLHDAAVRESVDSSTMQHMATRG